MNTGGFQQDKTVPLCWEWWGSLSPEETYRAGCTDMENSPTLNELRFVDAPHVFQNVVVEGLGQLCRHGRMEVRLVAFQDALQRELTHAQHLVVQVHDVFAPRAAILISKQPQMQDFVYSKSTPEGKKGRKSVLIKNQLKNVISTSTSLRA